MAVQLDLLETFLLSTMHDDGKVIVKEMFNRYRANKLGILLGAFQHLPHMFHDVDPHIRSTAVTAMAMGIVMAHSTEDTDLRNIFQGWLDNEAKARGENVVDFFTKGKQ